MSSRQYHRFNRQAVRITTTQRQRTLDGIRSAERGGDDLDYTRIDLDAEIHSDEHNDSTGGAE
jgi:hypothetical protein